jgi:5-methylcytosine-specific restriction endonuclease McrA
VTYPTWDNYTIPDGIVASPFSLVVQEVRTLFHHASATLTTSSAPLPAMHRKLSLQMYYLSMLKHTELAQIFFTWRDISITYDDGKTFAQGDPRINRFTRRKRKAESISARLLIGLTVGKNTTVHIDLTNDSSRLRHILIEDNSLTIDQVLHIRAEAIIQEAIRDKAEKDPVRFEHSVDTLDEIYWLFEGKFFKDTENLTGDEVKAVLLTRKRMKKARINRAKTIASTPEAPVEGLRRGFIPEDVRLLVWERDGGKCARCGSRIELQYDHIIPFSLGGSSTAENLQILCGPCNRVKSNSIA